MLIFRKDSVNVIRTSLAELSTLASPTYLIEMISDQSLISTTCIAADTSAYPSRYNEFTITETATPNNLNAEILLEPVGYFTYNIYEQTSTTNLSPSDAGVILLESGKSRCLIDGNREATTYTFYDTPTPQVAFWSVFDSEGIVPTPPTTDATYQNSDSSFVQVIPKATTYTAPDISFTDSDGSVIPTPANTDIVATPVSDATYQNSDLSFTQLIPGGTTYTSPDISFTDSDGTVSSKPSNTDLVCTPGTTVSGILYNRPIYSGWRTSFANYDEAWQKANGTYTYTKINPATIAKLDFSVTNAFFFLTENNSFGNLARFTDENGYYYTDPFNSGSATDPSAFASDYVIDHLTGLGWRRTKISGNWATLLSSAESQTFATYSDWRIPTIYELFSLVNCDTDALIVGSRKTGMEWYPFDQPTAAEYNSATTNAGNTSEIYTYFSGVTATLSVNLNRNPKTLNAPAFTVRNHFT